MAETNPERRARIQELFLKMLDSDHPLGLLNLETDPLVRAEAGRLWRHHMDAEADGFLAEAPSLVRELRESPARTKTWEPGKRLAGRFVVLEFLGEGGMGEVYLAHDDRLNGKAALKTIRQELLDLPELRERLAVEVRNARQVTHPNVCRIYDIYDDAGSSFYAMEYLPGRTLSAVLEDGGLTPKQSLQIAVQLAEALHAAHEKSILHLDFKPGNVILTQLGSEPRAVITDFGLARAFGEADSRNVHSLRAGTIHYMAPELLQGTGPASVQSDLYAYGKVLAKLLPGHSLIARLTAEDPHERPDSMVPVIETLKQPGAMVRWTRRGLLTAAVGTAGWLAYSRGNASQFSLGTRQRVIVNGLRGELEPTSTLRAIQSLLELALVQSPLLNVVPDSTLRAALRKRSLPGDLPAKLENLFNVASQEGARLIADGDVRRAGNGLLLNIDLFVDGGRKPQLRVSEAVDDSRQLVSLAERTVLKLRKECGESAGAIRNSYSPLERATSAVPEAVQFYFEAIQQYEQTHVEPAIALLDKAVALDDQFALAWFYRGLALSSLFRTRSGFESCERAFRLRDRTTPRERAWIESQYYNLAGDRLHALEAYKKNAFLFPDDAIFQRQLGYGYARIGQFQEALKCNQRAVELDPFSVINRGEQIVNLTEAMRYDEALAAHQAYLAQGGTEPVPNWGAGLALLGKRRYDDAAPLFEAMGREPEYGRWARQLLTIAPILKGDLRSAAFQLEGDVAFDIATGDEYRMLERRVWLGWTNYYLDRRGVALSIAHDLAGAPSMPNYIFAFRAAGRLAAALRDQAVYETALEGLRKFAVRYPSTYLSAAIAGLIGEWSMQVGDMAAAGKAVSEAVGLFPDVQTLVTAAHYFRQVGDLESERVQLGLLEAAQGSILKREWPGWIPLFQFEQARCLADLRRESEARPYLQLVQESWGRQLAGTRIGESIRALSAHVFSNRA